MATDILATVRAMLAAQGGVTALTGSRIYAGTETPPNYEPADGAALVVSVRGGGDNYPGTHTDPSVQLLSYALTEAQATALDTAVRDGRIQPGQLVMLEAMGGGFAWGASLIRV